MTKLNLVLQSERRFTSILVAIIFTMIMMSNRIPETIKTALVVVMLLLGSISLAQDEHWGIEKLMKDFSMVKHAELSFSETKRSIFLVTDLNIEGTIKYRAPDYIEKNTVTPFIERVVIDGDSMVIEKTTKEGKVDEVVQTQTYSVQSHPVLRGAVESIRAMLAGDIEVLEKNYHLSLEGENLDWRLSLAPKESDIQEYIEAIKLHGSHTEVKEIVTIQADGDESKLKLTYQLIE